MTWAQPQESGPPASFYPVLVVNLVSYQFRTPYKPLTMASFSQLPNEIIILVAKAIPHQKDLSSLGRTNRRLYDLLHAYSCRFNIQHHQAFGLIFAAESGRCSLAKKFLDAGASIASFGPQSEHDEWKGWNPLEAAAKTRHTETLKTLLAEPRPDRRYTPAKPRYLL